MVLNLDLLWVRVDQLAQRVELVHDTSEHDRSDPSLYVDSLRGALAFSIQYLALDGVVSR